MPFTVLSLFKTPGFGVSGNENSVVSANFLKAMPVQKYMPYPTAPFFKFVKDVVLPEDALPLSVD